MQVRRQPTQRRGEERVAAILDATEKLVLENGPENVTTNHLASAMGVKVGTIYHFFSDKFQIFHATITRGFDRIEAAVVEAAETDPGQGEWIDVLVDAYRSAGRDQAAMFLLWESLRTRDEIRALDAEYTERIQEPLAAGLRRHYPHVPPARLRTVSTLINFVILDIMGETAYAATPADAKALMRELREMLRSYLTPAGAA